MIEDQAADDAHRCQHCGDPLSEDHECAATDQGVDRVKVILPEHAGSEAEHLGKEGFTVELDSSTGRALVIFDGDDQATEINACCLQMQ